MNVMLRSIQAVWAQLWRWYNKVISRLGGRTIAMLAVALMVTIFSVIVSDYWINSIARIDLKISEVQSNIHTLHQLKTNLYKAESAQRAYLFTEREMFVQPFNNALKDARTNIDQIDEKLNQQTYGQYKSDELDFLKAISASLAAKAAEMKVTLSLSLSGKTREAKQVMNLDEGLEEMRKFVEYTDTLIHNQFGYLDELRTARSNTIDLSRISLIAGAIVIVILMILVIKQLLAEIVIKNDLQTMLAKKNESYEQQIHQQSKLLRSLALDYQADVERERQKLSRELHDELGSIFTATKMDVAWTIKKIRAIAIDDDTLKNELIEKLKKTSLYVDQGIQYQRHIVQELHPAMLSTFGFWPALTSLIEDAAERNHWDLTLSLPDENTKLNETISLIVYRIVQETLNNANKYAKATAVNVNLMLDEQHLKLEIEDNGVGVDLQSISGNTHGLSGMRHRVLAIGGHFEMISAPNQGVFTRALVPLDTSEEAPV